MRAFLGMIGLGTLRTQLIAAGVVIVGLSLFGLLNSWKSDIEEKTRAEIEAELKDAKIKTQEKVSDADEKVFNADDSVLCVILGGCMRETDNGGDN